MPSLSYTCPCYHMKRKRIFICKKFPCKIWTCDFTAHRKVSKAKTSSSYSLLWTPKGKFTNYPGEQKTADREAKKTATDLMTIKDVCVCVCVCARVFSCWVMSNSLRPRGLQPSRLLLSMGFPRQAYWNGCRILLQGIFLTQVSVETNMEKIWQQAARLQQTNNHQSCYLI